jgi:hypothetical protein
MRSYREQLHVPVLWWILAVVIVLLLGSEVWAGLGGAIPALVYTVLAIVLAAFLVNWSAASVEVKDGTLRAGRATLALDQIGDVVPLDEERAAALRGPRADPAAHLLLRPYLKRAVYVAVTDPASTAPYWLIATRRPAELAAAIERAAGQEIGRASDRAERPVG